MGAPVAGGLPASHRHLRSRCNVGHVPLCQLCQLCPVGQRVPVPCCRYAHMPMPTPVRTAIHSAIGEQTSNAPRTGPMGTRQREPPRPAWTVNDFRPRHASYFAYPPSPLGAQQQVSAVITVAWGTPPAAQWPGHIGQVPLSPSGENPVGLMQMQFGSRYRRCHAETDRRRSSHALAAQCPHPLTLKVGVDVAAPEHDPAVTFMGQRAGA